jgi:hypothetical protein
MEVQAFGNYAPLTFPWTNSRADDELLDSVGSTIRSKTTQYQDIYV